jgi:hypothetical protein
VQPDGDEPFLKIEEVFAENRLKSFTTKSPVGKKVGVHHQLDIDVQIPRLLYGPYGDPCGDWEEDKHVHSARYSSRPTF